MFPAEVIPKFIFTPQEANEVTPIMTAIESYVLAATAAFLTGSLNINNDAHWNNYLAEIEQIGHRRMLSIMQTVYNRMYR
jgi:putative aldouronate transport system substrate-binding protein